MKKEVKGFVVGFLCAFGLMGSAFAANSIMAEIYPDNVRIASNGLPVIGSNFTYEDKTYAPVREVAEKAGCFVEYDDEKKMVSVYNRFWHDGKTKININGNDASNTEDKLVYYLNLDTGQYNPFFDPNILAASGVKCEYDKDNDVFHLSNASADMVRKLRLYAFTANAYNEAETIAESINLIGKMTSDSKFMYALGEMDHRTAFNQMDQFISHAESVLGLLNTSITTIEKNCSEKEVSTNELKSLKTRLESSLETAKTMRRVTYNFVNGSLNYNALTAYNYLWDELSNETYQIETAAVTGYVNYMSMTHNFLN